MLPSKTSTCFALLVGTLCVVFVLLAEPPRRVGDGCEYLLMTMAFYEKGQPYIDPDIENTYEEFRATPHHTYVSMEVMRRATGKLMIDQQSDFPHFWFYSLLAVPFYGFLKLMGGDVSYSFALLHLTLLTILVFTARQLLNRTAAWVAALLCLATPTIWFIDKAHTEFFTVSIGCIAVIALMRQRFSLAFFCFSVLATQNPPFGIVAMTLPFFAGWWSRRSISSRRAGWVSPSGIGLSVAGLLIMALHPVYYFWRFGVLTPQMLTGAAANDFKGLKAMTCFWLDPDIGLLANWPFLLVPVFAVIFFWVAKKQKVDWMIGLFGLTSISILAWSQSKTNNFNHGGTFMISRYALWYLPFLFPLFLRFAQSYRTVGRVPRLAAMLFLVTLVGLNAEKYWPWKVETYLYQTSVAEKVYRYFPAAYDPIPEIFIERNLRREGRTRAWAVSNRQGTKILVHHTRMQDQLWLLENRQELTAIPGCDREIDPRKLLKLISRSPSNAHAPWFYVNHPVDIFASQNGKPNTANKAMVGRVRKLASRNREFDQNQGSIPR